MTWTGRAQHDSPEARDARVFVAIEVMEWLDRELATRPYIAGDRYSIADITAQCALVLGKNTGAPIPEGLQNLMRWWDLVSARPTARA